MPPRPELATLRQLLAELQDDLAQMDGLVAELVRRLPGSESWTAEECSHVALNLHRCYTAAESAFERIERAFVGGLPGGDNWHQDLLRLLSLPSEGARPAILRRETARLLLPYLRFRYFLRHAYAASLESPKLAALVVPLGAAHAALTDDFEALLADLRAAVSG